MAKTKRKLTPAEAASIGGKAGTGKAKARTSEQARAAAMARWTNHRASMGMTATNSAGISL